jgi:hypothetical protein
MPKTPAKQPAIYNPAVLDDWIAQSGLKEVFDEFLTVTEGPADGRCLITVCEHIQRTITEIGFWSEIEPFKNWIRLADKVVNESAQLQQDVGAHLHPELRKNRSGEDINLLRGRIKDSPIFAMLSDEHQDSKLRVLYGSLQLHVIHGRWIEAQNVASVGTLTPLEVLKMGRAPDSRKVKLSDKIAKTVRDLSLSSFSALLEHIKPDLEPDKFHEHFADPGKLPLGNLYQEHFIDIRNWCMNGSGVKIGGHHSSGDGLRSRRPTFAEYVGHGILRIGMILPVEEGLHSQESILNRAGSDDETFRLGLHPLERAGGDTTIRANVNGAENTGEATAIARSHSRHFEINRRLFPWSNDQLRIAEFRRGILAALVDACQSGSRDELEIATLLSIMIDTGRGADEILAIPIEKNPNAWLCYQRPALPAARGAYYWAPIEPQYQTAWTVDKEKENPRATYLRFPASILVTQLVEKLMDKAHFASGKIFRREKDYKKGLSEWIRHHDHTLRATARRLTNLRWESLHRSTDGDLGTCCLTLGVGESIAAVELHYAVLHVFEARQKFEQSSRELWGEQFGEAPVDYDDASPEEAGKIIGIRAFPRLETVRSVVTSLRDGSREFFQLPAESFDFAQHAVLLNRAVLYATWHQMHAFATRAICDAYQPRSIFSADGISILRDKDFEDGHKARMVWADPTLLAHMEAIEQRLGEIRARTPDRKFPDNGPLWLISDDGMISGITPTTIAKHLGSDFPFPVNTPRKVMRYLLRVGGLSHEESEIYMGHWWQSREPWSPFSSFDWGLYLEKLEHLIPAMMKDLGLVWPPEESIE